MRSLLQSGREWMVSPLPDKALVDSIRTALSCAHPFAIILAQRGGPSWESLITLGPHSVHSPLALPDMESAVSRLTTAIDHGERIFIHGDFDVDGLTGAAVFYRGLRPLFPPNMIKVEVGDRGTGHGMSRAFVLRVIEEAFSLVITVDCGITNVEEIAELKRAGIDTIVTDHHLPLTDLPRAVAIVDPHRAGNTYPNPHLAGVGVAYKLICALYHRLQRPTPVSFLDLVGLGTIADLVPLSVDGEIENRALVREALALLAKGEGSSLGLQTLMSKLSIKAKKLTTSDIGYLIAPKLNAANRAGDPKVAFLLLTTEDPDQAEYLSEILLDYNRDREILQTDLIAQAREIIRAEGLDPRKEGFVFLTGKYWNEGILGLVASNLGERYQVPAIVISRGDRVSRGSCRSIEGFDIAACLAAQDDLLLQYGGHRMAAGFSVTNDLLPQLKERISEYVKVEAHRTQLDAHPAKQVDVSVLASSIDMRFYTNLASLGPYGQGNPPPRFLIRECSFEDLTLVGNRKQHLKGRALQNGHSVAFIAFRMGKHLETFEESRGDSLVCEIGFDDWRGNVQVQGLDLVAC